VDKLESVPADGLVEALEAAATPWTVPRTDLSVWNGVLLRLDAVVHDFVKVKSLPCLRC